MSTFAPDGYFREPIGPHSTHRGTAELRSFFARCFSAGGGIGLQHCAVTDDGVRCALEYNCVRWGSHDLPPQAGIGVYERGPDGLLAAARVYDDVEPPVERGLRASVTLRGQWPAIWPPSMCRISPVMNGDDSRNRMPSTTSLTWPTRPSGGSRPPSRVVGVRRVHRRLDDARRDGVDPDAAGGVLDGQ